MLTQPIHCIYYVRAVLILTYMRQTDRLARKPWTRRETVVVPAGIPANELSNSVGLRQRNAKTSARPGS